MAALPETTQHGYNRLAQDPGSSKPGLLMDLNSISLHPPWGGPRSQEEAAGTGPD